MTYCAYWGVLTLTVCLACLPMQSASQPADNEPPTMDSQQLPPCPDSPNCVSSQAEPGRHFVEPLVYSGTGELAFTKLKEVIAGLPGGHIIESTNSHLSAEFRTPWLKFTDDFEAILEQHGKTIQLRSASRIGYWDFGTNRKRVETIRAALQRQLE